MELSSQQIALKEKAAALSNGLLRKRAAEIDQSREYPWDVVEALKAERFMGDALQMFGARGYSRDFPLERMARDVRMFTIGGGTAQVLRTLVASNILGWKLPQTRDGYIMSKGGVGRD
jgi:alkylation response protein AidB-like acyl-CoA dehydrogenase